MNLPPNIPPEAVTFLTEMGYLDADRLHVGDAVPRITLNPLFGDGAVTIGTPTARPVVLIFGSYT